MRYRDKWARDKEEERREREDRASPQCGWRGKSRAAESRRREELKREESLMS